MTQEVSNVIVRFHSGERRTAGRLARIGSIQLVLGLVLGAKLHSQDEAAPAGLPPAPPLLAEGSARMQAVIQRPLNRLAPFRPWIAGLDNPWLRPRAVPLVRVGAPWGSDDALWIEVPEHTWTIARGSSAFTLVFSGRPRELVDARGWSIPFPPLEAPAWRADDAGGVALDCPLEGGLTVRFRVLPGDRMFEIRYGITNGTQEPLGESWAQICSGFERMGALSEQGPESVRLVSGGAPVGWEAAGQDLDWIDTWRDPVSCLVRRACFFKAHLQRPDSPARPAPHVMVLERSIDLPLVAKSSADGLRHVVFYSPCAREVMYNVLSPCCHADPFVDAVPVGETRWLVVYGLFYEGELGSLCTLVAEVDRALRTGAGFQEP